MANHPCDTCNAPRNNDLNRIIRCGTCFYIPNKMPSKYAPEKPPAENKTPCSL